MADDIRRNLSYLVDRLSNLESILIHLIEKNVISQNEGNEITLKGTPLRQNAKLLEVIQKKDWSTVEELFLRILRITGNEHCANKIEDIANEPRRVNHLHHTLLKRTWWPDKKRLIESLHKRKIGNKLLVDELHDRLEKDKNRMVVITESVNASKLTGMGGVGKTLTATWYAHEYEAYYDHVLWIDCGEGSLLTSFKALTRDLEIKDRNELIAIEDFARKSYRELMEFKCLWIFDNAENYRGEGGMIKILPQYKENFYCLITSRSSEWGVKNMGYGKISDLQLDIFTEQESMGFLRQKLDGEIKYTEFQVKELCRLLGNLPLAMQLAVAALNDRKIDLQNYIKETSAEDVKNIVGVEFDDYEKTINASVKIILDVLEKDKHGMVARDILTIFGYIRPDDVIIDFFAKVLKLSIEDLNEGIELLVKYSLISKELKIIDEEAELFSIDESESFSDEESESFSDEESEAFNNERTESYVSIHRLLQQVIRHNFREREKETLRKILRCNGFLPYKVIPFTKYADAELRKEFPKVKAELVDQQQLKRLVKENRFEESVELAKLIDSEINKHSTNFNYAICLEKNGQLEDCITVLEQLYQQNIQEKINYYWNVEMGLLALKTEVSKELVGGHLLVSHWKLGNREKLKEILEERKSFKMIHSQEIWTTLLRILDSSILTQSNYTFTNYDKESLCKIALGGGTKKIELNDLYVDDLLSIRLPNDLQELSLGRLQFKDGHPEDKNMVDISEWLPKTLNTLEISGYQREPIIIWSLGSISSLENVSLSWCSLNLDSINRISPRKLKLKYVFFIQNGEELANVNLNQFLNFHKMNRLELSFYSKKGILSIDLSRESANIEYLHLINVDVVTLKSSNDKGGVEIEEALEGRESSALEVFLSAGIQLPNLNCLISDNFSHVSHFRSPQLTYLSLYRVTEVNVDILPLSIKTIRIDNGCTILTGGLINLDKLILFGFSLQKVEEMLPHFHLKQLVIYYNSFEPVDLIPLMDNQILAKLTIAIGQVDWEEDDLKVYSIISKQVDRKSEYYLFHEGTGKAIEENDFEKLYEDIFS